MKLIEQLIGRAARADAEMGQLAARGAEAERRKMAYKGIERELERMMGDGLLTQEEMGELIRAYRAEGLDTSSLEALAAHMREHDGVVGVAVDGDDRSDLLDELRMAGRAQDDPNFNFKAQELISEYRESFDLASRVQKSEHDMYMTAIRNMKA